MHCPNTVCGGSRLPPSQVGQPDVEVAATAKAAFIRLGGSVAHEIETAMSGEHVDSIFLLDKNGACGAAVK